MNSRITCIDALRGLTMFTMIFVNNLASARCPKMNSSG